MLTDEAYFTNLAYIVKLVPGENVAVRESRPVREPSQPQTIDWDIVLRRARRSRAIAPQSGWETSFLSASSPAKARLPWGRREAKSAARRLRSRESMYLSIKLAIATLVAGAGVGVPFVMLATEKPAVHSATISREADQVFQPAEAVPYAGPMAISPSTTEEPAPPVSATISLPDVVILPPPVESRPAATSPAAATSSPSPAEPVLTRAPPPPARSSCGLVTCAADQECCNSSCGICVPPGGSCTNKICGRPEVPESTPCGPNTCNVGQICCNSSCGICVQPGETCAATVCNGPTLQISVSCGMNTCNVGEVCCNASCGTCTQPGASCSQKLCDW
jgi:hypothetical protein